MKEVVISNDLKCMTFSKNDISRIEKEAYNQALEDLQKGIKEILEDNAIYNIDCIDTLVNQLYKW